MSEPKDLERKSVGANDTIAEVLLDYKYKVSLEITKAIAVPNRPCRSTPSNWLPLPPCRRSRPGCGFCATPRELRETVCWENESTRDMETLSWTCRFVAGSRNSATTKSLSAPQLALRRYAGVSSGKVDRLGGTRTERLRVLTIVDHGIAPSDA
ncbi:hypothetical protein BD309DRAFT_1044370 [Dichomitus squalens]|nr:hypothetical protein BD309DRAFT_1044370 [Dichomitus squalens]